MSAALAWHRLIGYLTTGNIDRASHLIEVSYVSSWPWRDEAATLDPLHDGLSRLHLHDQLRTALIALLTATALAAL